MDYAVAYGVDPDAEFGKLRDEEIDAVAVRRRVGRRRNPSLGKEKALPVGKAVRTRGRTHALERPLEETSTAFEDAEFH